MRTITMLLLVAVFQFSSTTVSGDTKTSVMSTQQWHEDLEQLSEAIKSIHFKPFHGVSEEEFDSAVNELAASLTDKTDSEIIVAMAQIVALLRDGHSRLHIPRLYPELALEAELGHSGTQPPKVESLKFSQLPVSFSLFDNGLYITATTKQHQSLLGHQVLAIGQTRTEDAINKVKSVSFYENESRAKLMAPDRLALPEVIQELGIISNKNEVSVSTISTSGQIQVTELQALITPGAEFVNRQAPQTPLWLKNRDQFRWFQVLPEQDAIYVQINQFEENPEYPYGDFVAGALASARQAGVSRFIVDLRHNSGGIGAWVIPFVTGLSRSEFNEYGRLYVLTGRTTFSAAQHFLHRFEELTYALFVGEPSGAKPSHFGDGRRVILNNSGLTLRVSTIYWHSWLANDFREAIQPHIDVTYNAVDYFSGHDPVLEAALRYKPPATLAQQMDEQFRQGNNQNGLLLYQRYMTDGTFTNHKQAIPGLLEMADRLVEDGFVRPGYFVYFITNASFPGDPDIEAGMQRIRDIMN